MDSEASSQSSDSGPEGPGISQVSRKPKQRKNQCKAWNFQYTVCTDLLGEEGVTTHEKMNLLTKQLQTRLGHKKPHAVLSVIVLCYFEYVLLPSTDVSPLISFPITGYVQSQNSTVYAMGTKAALRCCRSSTRGTPSSLKSSKKPSSVLE